MNTEERIKRVQEWLHKVTGLEEQAGGTVGWLIARAAEDPAYLARAGRKVWSALHGLLDGSGPVLLRNLPAPLGWLYEDQPERMRKYPLFAEFYGVDESLAQVGNFFERADGGHEEERQAFWLWGPPGGGKTSIARTICERLEDFTFWTVKGCEYHEHPLHMVPKRQRSPLFDVFYPFDGSPCPECWRCLQNELPYDKRWWTMPVQELSYSEGAACGIAFVDHRVADQKGQSLPEEWIQALQKEANGGVLIVQCTKEAQPGAFLELVGEVIQSRRMNIKESAARVCLDMAVIFLANQSVSEYKSGDTAFRNRARECVLPLVVSPRAEKQVVEKLNRHLAHTHHFMPHVEDALNIFVCSSRLRDSGTPLASMLLKRLNLYDGSFVEEAGTALPLYRTRKQMRQQYVSDGMLHAMSIRSALKMRSIAGELCEDGCVTIIDALAAAQKQLESENLSGDANSFPKRFLEDSGADVEVGGKKISISQLEALVYQKAVQRDIVSAWVGPELFQKNMAVLQKKYLDHAGAYKNMALSDGFVDKEREERIDEQFLRRVEGLAGIEKAKEDAFRQEVCQFFSQLERRGISVALSDIPVLEMALWKEAAAPPLLQIQVAFGITPMDNRDPEKEKKQVENLEKNLLGMGYQPCCVLKLLGNRRTSGYIRRMNLKL